MGTATAQIHPSISADGIGSMDSALKTLKAALEAIRGTATKALSQIEQTQEERSMPWTCSVLLLKFSKCVACSVDL